MKICRSNANLKTHFYNKERLPNSGFREKRDGTYLNRDEKPTFLNVQKDDELHFRLNRKSLIEKYKQRKNKNENRNAKVLRLNIQNWEKSNVQTIQSFQSSHYGFSLNKLAMECTNQASKSRERILNYKENATYSKKTLLNRIREFAKEVECELQNQKNPPKDKKTNLKLELNKVVRASSPKEDFNTCSYNIMQSIARDNYNILQDKKTVNSVQMLPGFPLEEISRLSLTIISLKNEDILELPRHYIEELQQLKNAIEGKFKNYILSKN